MIYIIRHGQTEMNYKRRLQGRSDVPLNDAGRAQAKEAAGRLAGIPFDYVYSSPLKRAVETAEILVPSIPPVLDDLLLEMDYGPYEGCDLTNLPPEVLVFFSDFIHEPAPAGMEQLNDVVKRAGEFLEEIRYLEGNILISTHAIAMKGLIEYLTPEAKGKYWNIFIGNCAIYQAENHSGILGIPTELKP